jgi:hypothetical protein
MTQANLKIQNIKIYIQNIYAKKLRNIEIFVNILNFIGENRCKT